MFTQIITQTEESIVLEVPKELRGHTIQITLDDLGKNGKKRFHSVEEALAQFSTPTLDTRGWKFNRDEANERGTKLFWTRM